MIQFDRQHPQHDMDLEPQHFRFRDRLGRPLRVGGIDYLNSRPLIETFDLVAGDEVELFNLPPSELARRLRSRELDVALVPVVEYLTAPEEVEYSIVPGLGISSYGSVESIRLFHRRSLGSIERVALDRSSMTSVLLTRLLFAERPDARWSQTGTSDSIAYETVDPEAGRALLATPPRDDTPDAVLLIGDAALEAGPETTDVWRVVDLGLEWTRWQGLPFVYAFWVFNGEPIVGVTECLHTVYRTGLASIDRIVASGPLQAGMSAPAARRYLAQVLRFRLGEAEVRGIEEFSRRLVQAGLLSGITPRMLEFLDSAPHSPTVAAEGQA